MSDLESDSIRIPHCAPSQQSQGPSSVGLIPLSSEHGLSAMELSLASAHLPGPSSSSQAQKSLHYDELVHSHHHREDPDLDFKRKEHSHVSYICDFPDCLKTFTSGNGLKYHRRTHTGEKLFQCTVDGCGKTYSTKSNLTEHVRSHTGDKPFVCDDPRCDKRFTSANGLKYHRRTHSGEKLFTCSYEGCHKCYTTLSNLKEHRRVHTGEKPFVCDFEHCNKCFTTANGLKYHRRIHTGEKLFTCDYDGCNKTYSTNSNLLEHKRNTHEGFRSKRKIGGRLTDDKVDENEEMQLHELVSGQVSQLVHALTGEASDLNKANAATEIWRLVEDYTSHELSSRQLALASLGAIEALITFAVACEVDNYRYRAFGALSNLCYRNPEVSHKIGMHNLLVHACTKALQSLDENLKTEALRALNNIAFFSLESHTNILPLVSLIVSILDDPEQSKEVRFMCCNVLENLSVNEQTRHVILPVVHAVFKAPTTIDVSAISSSSTPKHSLDSSHDPMHSGMMVHDDHHHLQQSTGGSNGEKVVEDVPLEPLMEQHESMGDDGTHILTHGSLI